MNLYIGKNIRAYRLKLGLTQEQLAQKLGISYQSVSRWENEITYPDIELLPAIARLFSVSVDKLIGVPEEEKEDRAKELVDELNSLVREQEPDAARIKDILRELRRNHLECRAITRLWNCVYNYGRCFRHPEVLLELRLTAEELIHSTNQPYLRDLTIDAMARIEDDEHIDEFLDKYASTRILSKEHLLGKRYFLLNDTKKHEEYRQNSLYLKIHGLLFTTHYHTPWIDISPEQELEICLFQINLLHSLCKTVPSPRFPISGNGEPDYWFEQRIMIGLSATSCYAALGKKQEALIMLEDCVQLIEKLLSATEPITLSCNSPWLPDKISKGDLKLCSSQTCPPDIEIIFQAVDQYGPKYLHTLMPFVLYKEITNEASFGALKGDEKYESLVKRLAQKHEDQKKRIPEEEKIRLIAALNEK